MLFRLPQKHGASPRGHGRQELEKTGVQTFSFPPFGHVEIGRRHREELASMSTAAFVILQSHTKYILTKKTRTGRQQPTPAALQPSPDYSQAFAPLSVEAKKDVSLLGWQPSSR
jgi:hypothetical protein